MIPENNYYRNKGSELTCVKHGHSKIGKNLNSKIPNANELICEYDEGFAITKQTALEQNQQTNVNPVKRLWEAKRIRFPGRGILPNSSSTPTSSGCTATLGAEPLFYSDFALLLTFEQQKKYLELGINESLSSSSLTLKQIEESAITDRCSSEPDVEPADYGFSLLFTAGKLVGD